MMSPIVVGHVRKRVVDSAWKIPNNNGIITLKIHTRTQTQYLHLNVNFFDSEYTRTHMHTVKKCVSHPTGRGIESSKLPQLLPKKVLLDTTTASTSSLIPSIGPIGSN